MEHTEIELTRCNAGTAAAVAAVLDEPIETVITDCLYRHLEDTKSSSDEVADIFADVDTAKAEFERTHADLLRSFRDETQDDERAYHCLFTGAFCNWLVAQVRIARDGCAFAKWEARK